MRTHEYLSASAAYAYSSVVEERAPLLVELIVCRACCFEDCTLCQLANCVGISRPVLFPQTCCASEDSEGECVAQGSMGTWVEVWRDFCHGTVLFNFVLPCVV